jgi:hypothetical protein
MRCSQPRGGRQAGQTHTLVTAPAPTCSARSSCRAACCRRRRCPTGAWGRGPLGCAAAGRHVSTRSAEAGGFKAGFVQLNSSSCRERAGPGAGRCVGQCARRWSCARNSAGGRRNSEKRTPAQHGAAELHLLQEASRQSFGNQASSPFPNKARQHRHGTARRTGLPDGSSAAAAGTRSRCHVVASIRWQVKPAGVASSHCSAFGNSRSRPCLTLPPLSWPVQRRVHNGVPAGLSGRPRRRAGRGQRPCGTAVVGRSACLPSLRSLPVHAERAGPILDSVCPAVGDGEEGSAAPGSGTRAD